MSPRQVGPWSVTREAAVYDNPWITVIDHDVVHPAGEPGRYGVVRFKNRAVGVLPIDGEGMVWLVGQHRFPLDRHSWELPEGGGPLDEDPLAAARRELKEETGLSARTWIDLAAFDVSNSVTDEEAVCFLAADLEEGEAAPEASESLEIRKVSFDTLLHEVLTGRIRDSLTIVMALAAHAKGLRGELPAAISKAIVKAAGRKGD